MCGICGYIGNRRVEDRALEVMRDTMVHRGPDDAGIWQSQTKESSSYVGLAHRRLSILDLSELGHQPMISADGCFVVVFNGEIYNFKELRAELEKEGMTFRSDCDTEVILYSYVKWGCDCFSKLNGMFAIAIWDINRDALIMARDRMGVKPFYYYYNPAEKDFAFASELKPIMKYPYFHKDIDDRALSNYLCYKYVAAPKTIFRNTYKLEPGTYAVFKNNNLQIHTYWDIKVAKKAASQQLITDYVMAKRELNDILTDAVMKRMVADVPVGTFLSSGIDSALVTAIAQNNTRTPVNTFTIGFNEKERNEADTAKKIAEYLGTHHTEVYIGEKEILDMIDGIAHYYDEPFADSSQLPTMLVSKLAADNVTVALSGDGGDELFCGYKMYDLVYIAQKVDWIGNILYHIPGMNYVKKSFPPELCALMGNRSDDFKTQLFIDVTAEQVRNILGGIEVNPKHANEIQFKYKNWQERRMLLDMVTYLPDEIMCKTDRAAMKYSLEVRSPLLDYRVVEKSFRIPHKYKYSFNFPNPMGDKKYILKELAYDYIPPKLLSASKRGFGVPLADWLRGPLKDEIRQYSDADFIIKQGLFDEKGIKHLVQTQKHDNKIVYSSILWSFYMFQRWWQEYM